MKNIYLLLSFLLTFWMKASAQHNFVPGYIINLQGDTTKGLINYKDWLKNPPGISFKTTDGAEEKQYTPDLLKEFVVNGLDRYVAFTGEISTAPINLANIGTEINTAKTLKAVFLRTVVSGTKASLFSYNDDVKMRLFIADGNNAPVELALYVYKNYQTNSIVEQRDYIHQLHEIAMKYEPQNITLQRLITRVSYQQKEIEKIITQINGSVGVSKNMVASREGVRWFAGLSANLINAVYNGEQTNIGENIFSSSEKSQSFAPMLSGGVDYFFNKNVGTLLFRAEASVYFTKIAASHQHTFTDYTRTFIVKEDLGANQVVVSFNPQFIYNVINKKNIKLYFAGGVQFNKAFYNNKYYFVDFYENNTLNNRNERTLTYRNLFVNLTTKVGVSLPSGIELFTGYNAPSDILNSTAFSSKVSVFKFGVNYQFSVK